VRRLDGVGRREVVVLAGVDDDPRPRVDLAREPLVHKGSDRVDVAEEDAVHRVVEHHVEPLEAGQGGDLRHTEAAGVVGQPDVPPDLAAGLVERRPHEPEVLLGGVGARIPLVRRALRHVVEQRLAGGPDDGDDVGALARGGLGLGDVLVDVAGGDDEVDPGSLRRVAESPDEAFAGGSLPVDGADAVAHRRARGPPGAGQLRALGQPEGHRPRGRLLREDEDVLGLAAAKRIPDRGRHAVLEADLVADRVDQVVDPRDPLVVGAGQPREPERGPLDRDRGVPLGELDHGAAGASRQCSGPAHDRAVELEARAGRRRHLTSLPAAGRSPVLPGLRRKFSF
jgi:hypothetical protein